MGGIHEVFSLDGNFSLKNDEHIVDKWKIHRIIH